MFVVSWRPRAMVTSSRVRAPLEPSAQRADEGTDRSDALRVDDAQGLGADDGDVRLAAQEVDVAFLAHAETDGERQRGSGTAAREVVLERLRELRSGTGDAFARDAVDEAAGMLRQISQPGIRRVRREDEYRREIPIGERGEIRLCLFGRQIGHDRAD